MMDLAFFARACGGVLTGENRAIGAVCTDSRNIVPGCLFVAIAGERFDGHDFVAAAFAAGAAGALVNTSRAQGLPLPRVVVDDTVVALGRAAAVWRDQFELPVLALTGSNGKTTVKEMLAAICRAATSDAGAVLATEGNFNNQIGLPLTLLRLTASHRYAVIEMGMNHPGEIRYLSGLTSPTVALINNAQRAHLEGLGSIAAVARAKGEIFEGLRGDGTAVINADDSSASLWRDLLGARKCLEFGLQQPAAVRAVWAGQSAGSRLTLTLPGGDATLLLPVPGEHNVRNALAAAACACAAGIGIEAIVAGLGRFRGVPGRLQELAGPNGARLINDCYNANPDSVKAAITVLAARPGKRVLALGDMRELGPDSPAMHEAVLRQALASGIERVYVLGDAMGAALARVGNAGAAYGRVEDMIAALRGECSPATTVLIKGSRSMRMERVTAALGGMAEVH